MAEPAHRRGAATRAQVSALLKGLIYGPNGRPMSPSHTRRRGRVYRYYVSREAIADGYDSCPMTSVRAADVEGAVLNRIQKLLAAPELVARTWAAAKREGDDEITERDVTVLLAEFATVWNELFPAEQARILQLMVERVDVQEDALEVRIRTEGEPGRGIAAAGREEGSMKGVESRLDGSTLVVRIPMRFQRRGGRKRIVAPDGSELMPATKPRPDGALLKALSRAWRWQRMLDEGIYGAVSDIGDAENISKSYVSRILRLALLAPDIVEEILAGRTYQGVMLEQLEQPLPGGWEEQRRRLQ
jgi:Recombinase zinc beta ribbon domain